ncbi:MAG: PKD domain-containing protein [Chitinophagaceae bacterium]|nr:PKD domain-containing protein [Chitinophagaceae bacterium]
MAPGSSGLARIDRVAGAPVANITIPALQLTPALPVNIGINFWNMQETIQCPPATASANFIFTRESCNSFRFHLPDSALWNGYTLVWDFGDGTPIVNSLPSASILHVYTNPGTYAVSLQLGFQVVLVQCYCRLYQ